MKTTDGRTSETPKTNKSEEKKAEYSLDFAGLVMMS